VLSIAAEEFDELEEDRSTGVDVATATGARAAGVVD
jgi:hypothetical protein